jgi:hypothetical protein
MCVGFIQLVLDEAARGITATDNFLDPLALREPLLGGCVVEVRVEGSGKRGSGLRRRARFMMRSVNESTSLSLALATTRSFIR